MDCLMIPIFLGLFLRDTKAVTHSLKYFYTSSSQVPNFPEFVSVGYVDDTQIDYYDSINQKQVLKQDWMNKAREDDPRYLQINTNIYKDDQWWFKNNIEKVKNRFNQTGGAHIFQMVYGCHWDDETNTFNGYEQYGYDGEDFIILNIETMKYFAPIQQAVTFKQKWDDETDYLIYWKNYLTGECIDWLKKYVKYGRNSLMRTDLPSMSLLQKSPSSPVTCHASGFYPESAVMFWRKDGKKLDDSVRHGEILPNHDKSFQKSVDLLRLPSDDWGTYECVFQLDGVELVTKLNKDVIRTNYALDYTRMIIVGVTGAALLLLVVVAIIFYTIFRGKKSHCDSSPENRLELNEKENQGAKL